MFRLVLDVPLFEDEQNSAKVSRLSLEKIKEALAPVLKDAGLNLIQYRLQRDEDRTPKNFLEKNENGHVPTGKARIVIE
jgi:hypothetical protein